MRNIKLKIAYEGTNYAGWQFQKNARSIQEVLEKAILKVLGEKAGLTGSGRTDAGVHAMEQVANFKTTSKMPCYKLQHALNANIPDDIAITDCSEVPLNFNSRFAAKKKVYRYSIFNKKHPHPFYKSHFYRVSSRLDERLMMREARHLIGRHDFKAFQARDKKERGSVRTIKRLTVKREGDCVYFDIVADGFLYHMVRNIAGTLIYVGRGKMPRGSIKRILRSKNRSLAGPTAPGKGLCLMKIKY